MKVPAQKAKQGSLGFYQWLSESETYTAQNKDALAAVKVLTEETKAGAEKNFLAATHIGEENDATSLDMMVKSIAFMKECNAIRATENLDPLKITSVAMAWAQADANWTANHYATTKKFEHARVSGLGENIAAGYKPDANISGGWDTDRQDPFYGWYTDEKKNFVEQNGGETGHYENIVYDYTVTGFGMNGISKSSGYTMYTHSQTFDGNKRFPNYNTDGALTVEGMKKS